MERINLPTEQRRLQVKELAEEVRIKYAKKGISDIFDVLSAVSFLIRKPLESMELSGFTTYLQEQFVVFLNSSFTLGHERFTGAHELYHVIFNADIIRKEKLLFPEERFKQEDSNADIFAAEFLMPEDYLKEVFYKIVNIDSRDLKPRHIVRMHNYFKVSYKAMLKRLIQLGLCSIENYDDLAYICTLENKHLLQELTRKEGYDTDLITPSAVTYISKEYVEYIKNNYENNAISYKNMANCFNFLGLSPEQFGYDYPVEED